MILRRVVLALVLALWPVLALAAERIDNFGVDIEVARSGDITVVETIAVTAEGNQIRRGIYRDLPRYYEKNGAKLPFDYDVTRVTRNGSSEAYAIERDGNAFRIRIGEAEVFLPYGAHVYEIEYAVKNQVRYFGEYDELYWNVTGNYWMLPIAKARAVIRLPGGAQVMQTAGYTGRLGETGGAYSYRTENGAPVFETTTPLSSYEGLTVAVGFAKGAVDPPSAEDIRAEWWARNASALVLAAALSLLTLYYLAMYNRFGRDPVKPPVFPIYEPPAGYSPAAVHQVYHRNLAGHRALIASLLHLAVKRRLRIDSKGGKKTTLVRLAGTNQPSEEENDLLSGIFKHRETMILGDKYDAPFTSAYTKFRSTLSQRYGASHFKWNRGLLIAGVVATVIAITIAGNLSAEWTPGNSAIAAALVGLTLVFSYFLPAPTAEGQKVRTEIEGFRLYLKTAEKLHLDSVKPGSDAPPPMSIIRYEKILPYAVALGVEEPWTKLFETLIPETAEHYRPRWTNMSSGNYGSLGGLNKALVSSMSSGVSTALPQSSSSSGSGGGGSSGGGGGGGGGGGW